MKISFDYEYLPMCQFNVGSDIGPDYTDDCGEPAVAQGWWGDAEFGLVMKLCEKHLKLIQEQEKEGE